MGVCREGKPMKLDKEQLRRIINEAVRTRLTEDQYVTDVDDVLEADGDDEQQSFYNEVAAAMVTALIDRIDGSLSNDVHDMVASITKDDFMRPVRYEDVEPFAEKAVELVLSDPELKDALITSLSNVYRSAMRPR